MIYTFERFDHALRSALAATGLISAEDIELAAPKAKGADADLALPCFRAAKAQGANPARLASALAAAVELPADGLVERVEASGPYVNAYLDPAAFAAGVLNDVNAGRDHYGSTNTGAGQRVIVEYSSPNIAKRLHVGHIRSTIIGQAIANLYASLGYEVIRDNHWGDYGKQFGVNIAAIMRFGRPEGEGEAALAAMEQQYQRYNALMKPADAPAGDDDTAMDATSELNDEARAWSLKLEQDDPQAVELWQWMVDLTKTSAQQAYDLLGVRFDIQHGESFYKPWLGEVISAAGEAGLAGRDEQGGVVVKALLDGRGKELPTFLLQRSDGATLYLTRDIATLKYREETYNPDRIIYVVGQPQELHFRQTFALARALSYTDAELTHVMFGTVFEASGSALSTRKGNMVYLESLLSDAIVRAERLIRQKVDEGKTMLRDDADIHRVARMVGVGAVIYNDLYQDPRRNITLDWERMLAFEGNSAPYLQYMHARCISIMREAGDVPDEYDAGLLVHPAEQALLKEIARLPAAVVEATERFTPFVVADWLYATARAFSAFYDACAVLKADTPALRVARLHLVGAAAQALRNGLALLGLEAPERM